jgi:serine protease Do
MTSRSRAVATFFAVAMATTLLAAFFQSQVRRPLTAEARAIEAAASATPAPGAPLTLDTFRNIVKSKNAGVVNITTSQKAKASSRGNRTLPFPFFGGGADDDVLGPDERNQRSGGSGFIIDADGTILTNRHVVDEADQISVTLVSGKRYDAKVLGKDARTDVAVIKIEPKEPLTVLELGDSDAAEVGEWVMAIGSPFNFSNSLSVGVVSAKGRNLTLGVAQTGVDMIQTDAAINPGNSGGPLMNTRGQVIGINTLMITQGPAQSAGVGFSVSINVAKPIIPQLKTSGKVTRGWLGVTIQSASEDVALTFKRESAQGVVVTDVTKDSPAGKAGIQLEDYIYDVDGRLVKDNSSLTNYISGLSPGTTVTLKLIRDGNDKAVKITLGTFPDSVPAASNDSSDDDDAKDEEKAAANLGLDVQTLTSTLRERLELDDSLHGVVVRSVEAGGAAELAGLARRDVIVMVAGQEVSSVKEFNQAIRKATPLRVARLRVRRQDQVLVVALRLDR